MYVLLVSSVIMLHVNNIQQVKKLTELNQDLQKVNVWKVTVNQLSMEKQDVQIICSILNHYDAHLVIHLICFQHLICCDSLSLAVSEYVLTL